MMKRRIIFNFTRWLVMRYLKDSLIPVYGYSEGHPTYGKVIAYKWMIQL